VVDLLTQEDPKLSREEAYDVVKEALRRVMVDRINNNVTADSREKLKPYKEQKRREKNGRSRN
jgi:hypothetical protein